MHIDNITSEKTTLGADGKSMQISIYEKNIEQLQQENQELKLELSGYRQAILNNKEMLGLKEKNQELKKQLKKWENHLMHSKEMLDIQGQKGNYDYDEYMLGLYNGMEYIIALFETREPNFISSKDVKFTNNKTQQKEFIKYLENRIDMCDGFLDTAKSDLQETLYGVTYGVISANEDITTRIKENETAHKVYEEILQKYKSIVGE